MDHIDRHLASAARDNRYKPCIQAAVAIGKKLLNRTQIIQNCIGLL
jgi:hypothetical protein